MKNATVLLAFVFMAILQSTFANNHNEVVTLKGYWKFNIGDNPQWANNNFDDSQWDNIYAPRSWEKQGYVGYDGYAWYRKNIVIPNTNYNQQLYLQLGNIDDVNQVYFNGQLIGELGITPPQYYSQYNAPIFYHIPHKLINFNGPNTIAVRVYDDKGDGGIVSGPLSICHNPDLELLTLNLAGNWKIAFKNYKGSLMADYNDSHWPNITVPGYWESQGHNNYDGYACYRKTFDFNINTNDQKLYLILGKIDDRDRVYLNGKLIGATNDMYGQPLGNRQRGDWQIRRAYKIPKGLINQNGKNTVVVLVHDNGGIGGIIEGPVGIMNQKQFYEYESKYETYNYSSNTIFDFIFNNIID